MDRDAAIEATKVTAIVFALFAVVVLVAMLLSRISAEVSAALAFFLFLVGGFLAVWAFVYQMEKKDNRWR
jgi:hypothetical protein